MKFRRHHNNKGYRQIKTGKTKRQVARIRRMAVRLGILKVNAGNPRQSNDGGLNNETTSVYE